MTWTQNKDNPKKWFWTENNSILDINKFSVFWFDQEQEVFLVKAGREDCDDFICMGIFLDEKQAISYLEIVHKFLME